MIHTVKVFNVVIKAVLDVFLEFFCFFYDPMDVGNLISISGSSAFFKSSLNIWKFSVHVLLRAHLENFEHKFASMWNECNSVVVWTFFGIAFLWYWNENWPFPDLWPLLSFPNLLAYWVQHFGAQSGDARSYTVRNLVMQLTRSKCRTYPCVVLLPNSVLHLRC